MAIIGLLGHYGTGNLGDEAIIAAAVANVRSRCETAVIYGFSSDPSDTEARHKIAAFPVCRSAGSVDRPQGAESGHPFLTTLNGRLRAIPAAYRIAKVLQAMSRIPTTVLDEARFLMASYRVLRGVDLLMISGSGQLSDHFGGAWGMPYNLFKWSVLARAAGTKLAFVSVGAGPLASSLSRFFVRRALGLAHYRSFRDVGSRRLMEAIGAPGEKPVMPDLAHSLAIGRPDGRPKVARPGMVIGINVFPHCDPRYWPLEDAARYARYVDKIASVVLAVIARGDRVRLVPTQMRADPLVIADVERAVRRRGKVDAGRLRVSSCASVEDLIRELSGCDVVIATRFHAVVMALLLHTPVVALANHPKTTDLMADVGLSDHVLDIDRWAVESVMERLQTLEKDSAEARAEMAGRVTKYRAALERQYDSVLSLVGHG